MEADFNLVLLTGHITAEPELRYLQSGMAILSSKILSIDRWTAKNGEPKESALTIDLACWGKLAEQMKGQLLVGREVQVSGKLQSREWTSKSGYKNLAYTVNCDKVRVIGFGSSAPDPKAAAPTPAESQNEVGADELPF